MACVWLPINELEYGDQLVVVMVGVDLLSIPVLDGIDGGWGGDGGISDPRISFPVVVVSDLHST
ncbi:hypothetical protein ACFPVT_10155 [Corynebacterium choanae]|uniref:Uncharacterized protein n=1 Tax=Corynebacterium choanae TaxID=1862358 RepID=A0A3G6J9X9_9CORY|nr:hypothetical protein [Corynebacterium choanae]AZA12834.1 hypothetical protein CCHOA_02040 [Corynebacterium choanae]